MVINVLSPKYSFACAKVKLAGNKGLAKEVKADLSRTHFTLGNHKFDWQTDAMRTQVSAGAVPLSSCPSAS